MKLINSIPVMAGIYSQNFGVEVEVGRFPTASTDGKKIRIPYPDSENEGPTWGYVAHESAHLDMTDFKSWDSYIESKNARVQGIAHDLLNMVEDARIEIAFVESWPGTRVYFEELTDLLVSKRPAGAPITENTFLWYYVNSQICKYSAASDIYAQSYSWMMANKPNLIVPLVSSLDKTLHAESTKDCIAITDELLAILMDDEQDEQSDSESGDDDEQSDSESGDDDEQSDSESGDDEQSDSESGDDDEQSDSESGDDDEQSESESGDEISEYSDFQDKGQVFEQTSQSEGMSEEAFELLMAFQELVEGYVNPNPTIEDMTTHAVPGELANRTNCQTAAMRQKLVNMVKANARIKQSLMNRGTRVSNSRLSRLKSGNCKVFRKINQDKTTPNASITIIVDDSGSIGDDLVHTQSSALALVNVFESIKGVETSALGFGNNLGLDKTDAVVRLKHFNEKGNVVESRIASLSANGHSTPLSEGLLCACQDLSNAKKDNKIVIVITDGYPNSMPSSSKIVEQLRNEKVRVIGVGVGNGVDDKFLQEIYKDDYIIVRRFEDLPEQVVYLSETIVLK